MASQSNNQKSPTPQRAFKPNPVIQTRDAATKRRRDMFFRRVQNGREDKKWEARGEQVRTTSIHYASSDTNNIQIQQLDFVAERKRWEDEKARQAPKEDDAMVEAIIEDAPLPDWTVSTPQPTQEMTEADYVAAQEEHELQQLIAAMEEQDRENDVASQHFGSDDEDYDQLFMDCSMTTDQQYQQQPHQSSMAFGDSHGMDMDMTEG
jgi:hypothetical protein